MWRYLVGFGLAMIALGGFAWLLERAGLTPGRLPGDIVAGRGPVRVYFPIATSILLSILLTLALWVFGLLRR